MHIPECGDPCWRCGAAPATPAAPVSAAGPAAEDAQAAHCDGLIRCAGCGALAPPAVGLTAFERLGLPVAFKQPTGAVEAARRARLLAIHPDQFARAEPQTRALAQAHAVAINDAARAIAGPFERVSYLLELAVGDSVPARMDDADWQGVHELKLALRELDYLDAHVERSRLARLVAEQYERGLNEVGAALDDAACAPATLVPKATWLRALRSVLEAVQG